MMPRCQANLITPSGGQMSRLSAQPASLLRWQQSRGDYAPAPDLVAEIASESQSKADMRERSERWLAAGTRLIWNVWPDAQTVDVWTPDEPMQTLKAGDMLDGHDVVPGFSMPVADLFVFT